MPSTTPTAVYSNAFQLPGLELDPRAPEMIERDRLIMATRPGMFRKLLPLRIDESGVHTGGCYLFDTFENAQAYRDWVANDFALDGVRFLDRPVIIEPRDQLWQVVGFEDLDDVHTTQDIMRFERWHLLAGTDVDDLRERHWPSLRDRARDAGLTSVWLLYDPDEHHPQLGLVSVAARDPEAAGGDAVPDLGGLESAASLGEPIAEELAATKVFDRTSLVYMVWFPISGGDADEPALWPSSPPLPGLQLVTA
jgi:hypothetical protein